MQTSGQKSNALKANKEKPTKVFILREGNPVEVQITLGTKNRVSAEVLSGLSEDDEVVTGPMDVSTKTRPRVMIR